MTSEEAIYLLDNLIGMINDNHDNDYDMALKMGINSLKQEPKTDVLDKIRTEIEKMPSELTADGRRMIRRESVFRIIDKYKAESEVDE